MCSTLGILTGRWNTDENWEKDWLSGCPDSFSDSDNGTVFVDVCVVRNSGICHDGKEYESAAKGDYI